MVAVQGKTGVLGVHNASKFHWYNGYVFILTNQGQTGKGSHLYYHPSP